MNFLRVFPDKEHLKLIEKVIHENRLLEAKSLLDNLPKAKTGEQEVDRLSVLSEGYKLIAEKYEQFVAQQYKELQMDFINLSEIINNVTNLVR